jgi:hypothetical protein
MVRRFPFKSAFLGMSVVGLVLFIVTACVLRRGGTPKAPDAPLAAESPPAVDLEEPFRIPYREDLPISHVYEVVFTRDGRRLSAVTSEGETVVFDTGTGKIIRRIRLPEGSTDAASIDEDGRYLAWVPRPGVVAVMDIESGEVVARDELPGASRVAVAPDGRTLAVSCGAEVEILDMPTLQPIRSLSGHDGEITGLDWSPDGKWIFSVATDGRLLGREVEGGKTVLEVKKGLPLRAVAFDAKGGSVAYGGDDKQVCRRRLDGGSEEVISKDGSYSITCLGFSPDASKIIVGDRSCHVRLYDLVSGKLLFEERHHVQCRLVKVAWMPEGDSFLFGCRPEGDSGKPALCEGLTRAEARLSYGPQRSWRRLLRAIEAGKERTTDLGVRKFLDEYPIALEREEERGEFHAGTAGASLDRTALRDHPEIRWLADVHRATLRSEIERLESGFAIHQWRVRGK